MTCGHDDSIVDIVLIITFIIVVYFLALFAANDWFKLKQGAPTAVKDLMNLVIILTMTPSVARLYTVSVSVMSRNVKNQRRSPYCEQSASVTPHQSS